MMKTRWHTAAAAAAAAAAAGGLAVYLQNEWCTPTGFAFSLLQEYCISLRAGRRRTTIQTDNTKSLLLGHELLQHIRINVETRDRNIDVAPLD
jgi:hypothetical protein